MQKTGLLSWKSVLVTVFGFIASASFQAFAAQERDKDLDKREATRPLVYPVVVDDELGFIDATGKIVVKPYYDRIGECSYLERAVHGQTVPECDGRLPSLGLTYHFWGFFEGIGIVGRDGKLGYIRQDGTVLFAPQFTDATEFHDGVAWVEKDGKYALVNAEGKVVLSDLEGVGAFAEGLAPVKLAGRWGFIDRDGNIAIAPKWDHVGSTGIHGAVWVGNVFEEGVAWVWVGRKAGLIDRKGHYLAEPQFDNPGEFQSGVARVVNGDKCSLVDCRGQTVIPAAYDAMDTAFHEGLCVIKSGEKWGFIDRWGEVAIPAKYDVAYSFREGLALVARNGRTEFIDHSGRTVIPIAFAGQDGFKGGLAVAGLDANRCGAIDRRGNFVIPPRYDKVNLTPQGPVIVHAAGGFGVVSRSGSLLVETKFSQIEPFMGQTTVAYLDGKACVIDMAGRFLVRPTYDWLDREVVEGRRMAEIKGKFGFLDDQGQLVIPIQFDCAERFDQGIARVGMDVEIPIGPGYARTGKWGYIDTTGHWIWKPTE